MGAREGERSQLLHQVPLRARVCVYVGDLDVVLEDLFRFLEPLSRALGELVSLLAGEEPLEKEKGEGREMGWKVSGFVGYWVSGVWHGRCYVFGGACG